MSFADNTTFDVRFTSGSGQRPRFSGRTVVAWLAGHKDQWLERRRQLKAIRQLRALDDRLLRDIGIHRSEIVSTVMTGRKRR